jgi:methionine-rich copper-binding protein CopC
LKGLKPALFVATVIALTMAPSAAQAAPGYLTSQPEDQEKSAEAPENVQIVFDQPLDLDGILVVVDACEKRVDDGNVAIVGNTISVGIERAPSGLYVAVWRVKAPGGVGGEGAGRIEFTVTSGKACGAVPRTHGNHGGGNGGGGDGEHDGHGSGGGSGGGKHEDHTSSADSGTHGDHATTLAAGGDHDSPHGNGNGKGHGAHGKQGEGNEPRSDQVLASQPNLASPLGDVADPVSGSVVLASLLIALAMGVVGGWMIRTINP